MARQRRRELRGDAGRRGRGRAGDAVVTHRWDAVVVGAGPAGATTAMLLARAGASVLLIDRARFPRDKACSEYLSPATTEILERLDRDALAEVESAAHGKLYGMKVVAPSGAAMCGRFRGGPRSYSFALPRTTFDTMLLTAARRAGAHVCEATTVENLVWEKGAVGGVVARSCNGQRVTCNARIVVGADGLRSVVARRLGLIRTSANAATWASGRSAAASPRWRWCCRSRRYERSAGTSPAAFSPSSTDFPGSRGGSTPGTWFATCWSRVRSRSGPARPRRRVGEPCSWAMRRISSTRLRARGSTARCAAQSSPLPASSPRWRAGTVNPFRLRPCDRTCSPGGVSSSESGCLSDSSASASGGPRSPIAWCAAWRVDRTSRILWSAQPGTSSPRARCSEPVSWLNSSGNNMSGVDPAQFRQLLGRFATGVTVVTARDPGGRPVGMTASSVASVSLEPPLVLVSVDRTNDMYPALQVAKRFVLNVLAADQEAISRRFAEEHPNRFDSIGYRETVHGIPVLEGVLASIECEKQAETPGGDHTVFFGLVTGGAVSDRRPLLYYRGGYAGLGSGGE